MTWTMYAEGLDDRLEDLSDRVRRGAYRAPPLRRVYIPKEDGGKRPLGIARAEDKIVQKVVTDVVLVPIYEREFLDFSYGFRPKRGAHDALDALVVGIERRKTDWIVDADVRRFFDEMDRDWMIRFLEHRIGDKRVIRLVAKWLNAGVMTDGDLSDTGKGTPQGAIVSHLANIFLHHVLDKWVETDVAPRIGAYRLVRYADDFIIVFADRRDGERVLGKRLERFGLSLHPEKTRFVDFRPGEGGGHDARNTFDFLGFSHRWGRSRRGRLVVRQFTSKSRLARAVKSVGDWSKSNRHRPLVEQHRHLASVIRGHCQYYGLTGNGKRLSVFRHETVRCWRRWLGRRHRAGPVSWKKMNDILSHLALPPARVANSIYSP